MGAPTVLSLLKIKHLLRYRMGSHHVFHSNLRPNHSGTHGTQVQFTKSSVALKLLYPVTADQFTRDVMARASYYLLLVHHSR